MLVKLLQIYYIRFLQEAKLLNMPFLYFFLALCSF